MHISLSPQATITTRISFLTLREAENIIDFEGKTNTTAVRYEGELTQIYVGLGEEELTDELIRSATAAGIRSTRALKRTSVSLVPPQGFELVAIEAAILSAYTFDTYKSEKEAALETLEIVGSCDSALLQKTTLRAESVCYTRTLQNENAGIVVPEYLAEEARKIASTCSKMKLTILNEEEIVAQGLNLLWAVGKGSATPPRLIIMNYQGADASLAPKAIVGKGITFDTGGMNLKPTGSMEDMRMDMSGAAVTLGVMRYLANTEPAINVIGVIPTAQSALGKDAYYVGDTYTSYSGKTVEVLNTDAEGRLILADAISYLLKHYNPSEIVDLATLTGAILIALGDTMAGLFSNNEELAQAIFAAGEKSGDRVWQIPIRSEHREAIKGDIADIRNTSKIGRKCGSITAAAFIESFVEETPWVHLDIAGTAWNDGEPRGITPKFGTGFGVRLLLEHLQV